jgi:hypothetical protein
MQNSRIRGEKVASGDAKAVHGSISQVCPETPLATFRSVSYIDFERPMAGILRTKSPLFKNCKFESNEREGKE